MSSGAGGLLRMPAPQKRGPSIYLSTPYTYIRTSSYFLGQTLIQLVQAARVKELQRAYRRAELAHPRESAPRPGAIRSLGLLGKEEETKEVLSSTSK